MKRCLIYARVSTKNQTTRNQVAPLQEYAHQRGWHVAGIVEDQGISGTTNKRPGMIKVMAMAHRREFDVLLVYSLDRFGRSIKDCKVASKIDPQVATNIDPAGKFIRLKYQIKYIARGGAKLMQLMGQNG